MASFVVPALTGGASPGRESGDSVSHGQRASPAPDGTPQILQHPGQLLPENLHATARSRFGAWYCGAGRRYRLECHVQQGRASDPAEELPGLSRPRRDRSHGAAQLSRRPALAKSIKIAVLSRKMPPWFADPRYGHFSNDRRLSDADIAKLAAWVDAGPSRFRRAMRITKAT
jgi:hypothetical protein